jgi:hypothetical protein
VSGTEPQIDDHGFTSTIMATWHPLQSRRSDGVWQSRMQIWAVRVSHLWRQRGGISRSYSIGTPGGLDQEVEESWLLAMPPVSVYMCKPLIGAAATSHHHWSSVSIGITSSGQRRGGSQGYLPLIKVTEVFLDLRATAVLK